MNRWNEWLLVFAGGVLVVLGFLEEDPVLKTILFAWSSVVFASSGLCHMENKLDALKKDLYSFRKDLELKEALNEYFKREGSNER